MKSKYVTYQGCENNKIMYRLGSHQWHQMSVVIQWGVKMILNVVSFYLSILKQTRTTFVFLYDSGLNLSYSSWPAVSHNVNSQTLPSTVKFVDVVSKTVGRCCSGKIPIWNLSKKVLRRHFYILTTFYYKFY